MIEEANGLGIKRVRTFKVWGNNIFYDGWWLMSQLNPIPIKSLSAIYEVVTQSL